MQVCFALLIDVNNFDVFPEFPALVDGIQSEFDLLIHDKTTGEYTVVEFKYKTANSTKKPDSFQISSGESVILKNHGAIDYGWYDSWKDISRIEKCISGKTSSIRVSNGFFILITNDKGYWDKSEKNSKQAVEGLFMNNGIHKAGERKFKDPTKEYRGKRNQSFTIQHDYYMEYTSYCNIKDKKYGDFRILIVDIGNQATDEKPSE